MKALKKIGLAGVLVLASCFLVAAPSQAINIYDNFNDNSLDTNIWPEVFIEGVGPSLSETNQRLEITIPSTATPDSNGLGAMTAPAPFSNDMAQQPLDFDVQVDFNLLTWPAGNGIGVGMQLFDDFGECHISRASYGPSEQGGGAREVYIMYFSGTDFYQ